MNPSKLTNIVKNENNKTTNGRSNRQPQKNCRVATLNK